MQLKQRQKGFTLVEIAVVLVIIGLLLGGVLKGQELISSSRVRNLADQQAGIQAAYFGFQDRYRAVPGDMPKSNAEEAIGVTIETEDSAGTGNGRLEEPSADHWAELNGVWEHLSKAGFIKGSYNGSTSAPVAGNTDVSPLNVFSSPVILARHDGFVGNGSGRLVLHMGQNVPADIARELDTKLDDGRPESGSLRNASEGGDGADLGANPHLSGPGCVASGTDGNPSSWDIQANEQNCNPTYLF